MHTSTVRKSKLKQQTIALCWILSVGFLLSHIFYQLKPGNSETAKFIYDSVYRELWTCAICWIIYACHHLQSGKLLRTFLSQDFWQPLSKICLSVYLTHYLYIYLTHFNQKQLQWIDIWWEIHIHIADVLISFVIGGLFYLMIEAPTSRFVKVLFKK